MCLSLSDDDDEGSYSSTDDSSSGDDGAHQHLQSQSSVEVEIDHDAEDAGSQVSFDTMEMSETDFLTPGGLNSFSVVDSKRRHSRSRSRSRSKSKGFAPVDPRGFAGGTLHQGSDDTVTVRP